MAVILWHDSGTPELWPWCNPLNDGHTCDRYESVPTATHAAKTTTWSYLAVTSCTDWSYVLMCKSHNHKLLSIVTNYTDRFYVLMCKSHKPQAAIDRNELYQLIISYVLMCKLHNHKLLSIVMNYTDRSYVLMCKSHKPRAAIDRNELYQSIIYSNLQIGQPQAAIDRNELY